jgi:hypothetical protein
MGSILETAYAILNHPDPSRSVPVRTEKLHLLIFLRYPEDRLCCTNRLEDVLALTPDGFSLRLLFGVCQER